MIPDLPVGGLGSLVITSNQILVFGVTIALLLALNYIVKRTRIGMAMRAVSHNPTAAQLMGINIDVVISFTFGLGSALAGAAGILFAVSYPSIDPLMGVMPGLKAFVAAVLGGIGNLPGAALGGIVLGLVETFVGGIRLFDLPRRHRLRDFDFDFAVQARRPARQRRRWKKSEPCATAETCSWWPRFSRAGCVSSVQRFDQSVLPAAS